MINSITIKNMIAKSEIPAKLIRSTISQCSGFGNFKERAEDVTTHGISGGSFGGFIYYVDTCAFFKRNKKDIIALAESQAQEIGYKSLLEMIKAFRCMKEISVSEPEILQAIYQNKGELKDQIQNCLAWYACEEVCRLYCALASQD